MNKLDNLQATKEFELAQQIQSGINSFSFSPEAFAASIPYFHRTLQQSFWRVIVECVKVYADDQFGCDDRNKASHLEAKEMMEYLRENGRYIPYI
jgi:hypothetical protein